MNGRRTSILGVVAAAAILLPAGLHAEEPPLPEPLSPIPMASLSRISATRLPLAGPQGGIGIAPDLALLPRQGFYRSHFLPRLSRIMGELHPLHTEPIGHAGPVSDGAFEDLSDLTHRCFSKAARRAVRSFMLETSGLDEQARRYREGIAGRNDHGQRQTRIRFRIGASHAQPELQMRCRVGRYSGLRLALRASGKLGIEFDRSGLTRARMYAGYDRRDGRYEMALRLGF